MKSIFVSLVCVFMLVSCQSTSKDKKSQKVEITFENQSKKQPTNIEKKLKEEKVSPSVVQENKTALEKIKNTPKQDNYIEFIDSLTFDLSFSKKLSKEYDTVVVLPTGPMYINDIPEKLDKWFYQVKENGGQVKARAIKNVAFRGVVSAVIDIFVAIFENVSKRGMYSPAKKYNVMVEYYATDGRVKQVLFNHK